MGKVKWQVSQRGGVGASEEKRVFVFAASGSEQLVA